MKILFFLLISGIAFGQPKDRLTVKNILDGFTPKDIPQKITVAEIEKMSLIKVGNSTARLAREYHVIQITGKIAKIQHEADGDYHYEITDGTCKDSTIACEFSDPSKTKSPFNDNFKTTRNFIHGKKVGDEVTLTGILFQDRFHSPSPKRVRNFLEIHPILFAK